MKVLNSVLERLRGGDFDVYAKKTKSVRNGHDGPDERSRAILDLLYEIFTRPLICMNFIHVYKKNKEVILSLSNKYILQFCMKRKFSCSIINEFITCLSHYSYGSFFTLCLFLLLA